MLESLRILRCAGNARKTNEFALFFVIVGSITIIIGVPFIIIVIVDIIIVIIILIIIIVVIIIIIVVVIALFNLRCPEVGLGIPYLTSGHFGSCRETWNFLVSRGRFRDS